MEEEDRKRKRGRRVRRERGRPRRVGDGRGHMRRRKGRGNKKTIRIFKCFVKTSVIKAIHSLSSNPSLSTNSMAKTPN